MSLFIYKKCTCRFMKKVANKFYKGSNNHSSLLILQGSIKKIGSSLKSFHLLQQTKGNSFHCLISYCGGAWHYRIFPDFLNSGFKMASKTEGKAKHEKIKFVSPSGHVMFCLFYRYWWNTYIKHNFFLFIFRTAK